MVTDRQVRTLMKLVTEGKSIVHAAAKADMDPKTARKYIGLHMLPSEHKSYHTWRTRIDPFADVWPEIAAQLKKPRLKANTIFEQLQLRYPGRFPDGQLRTLQRKIKHWRITEGESPEVIFPQKHRPADLCASDFTNMNALGITIDHQPFLHIIYHFVLTYSNWETFTICMSENFESLSFGLQNALWELGGVPRQHLTDRLTAAVSNLGNKAEFQMKYSNLMSHYGLEARHIQTGKPNENGDVEQSHHRIKSAVEQALLIRGSKDFSSRQQYEQFLRDLFAKRNSNRLDKHQQEIQALSPLPAMRLDIFTKLYAKVKTTSIIRVQKNSYSVNSRLIGQNVEVRVFPEHLEVRYAGKLQDKLPRLIGQRKHIINYRHIIEWLVRKPGAFANYEYRSDLFPSSHFRMAYDALRRTSSSSAAERQYLQILILATKNSEAEVEAALRSLLATGELISSKLIEQMLSKTQGEPTTVQVHVDPVDLSSYDTLLYAPQEQEVDMEFTR